MSNLASLLLPNHALANLAGFEGVIKTKTTDVRVCTDSLNACEVAHFLGSKIHVLTQAQI